MASVRLPLETASRRNHFRMVISTDKFSYTGNGCRGFLFLHHIVYEIHTLLVQIFGPVLDMIFIKSDVRRDRKRMIAFNFYRFSYCYQHSLSSALRSACCMVWAALSYKGFDSYPLDILKKTYFLHTYKVFSIFYQYNSCSHLLASNSTSFRN